MIIITLFQKEKGFVCIYFMHIHLKLVKKDALPQIMNGIICVDAFYDAELEFIVLRENARMMKDFEDYNFKFVYKELLNIVY